MNMPGLHYDLDSLFPENPDFLQEEEICEKDYENIKRLYPGWIRRIAVVIEEYIDRYEFEGSPIYHEYPDEVTIYGMTDDIFYMIYGDMEQNLESSEGLTAVEEITASGYDEEEKCTGWLKDFLKVMLCNEINRRRRRHDRFMKCHRYRKSGY